MTLVTSSPTHSLSLAALTVLELRPHQMVETAARAGYTFVGLRLVPATEQEPHFPLHAGSTEFRKTLNALRDSGLKALDIEILRLKPDTRVNEFLPILEVGALLGASEVLVAGNDDDEARTTDNFAALCDLALPFNLHPALEFMPWTGVKNLSQAQSIVAAANRPNAALLVDAFHLNRSGSRIEDIGKTPATQIRYAQLCDIAGPIPGDMQQIIREARTERCFPGEGDIDLGALISALPSAIPLSLEVPTENLRVLGYTALQRATLARQAAVKLLENAT